MSTSESQVGPLAFPGKVEEELGVWGAGRDDAVERHIRLKMKVNHGSGGTGKKRIGKLGEGDHEIT